MTRVIFVTGGVCSSLGKGIAASSLGALLQARGYSVHLRKLEPYLNVDPGTMSPFQHGEVYVTDDGAETDLDLGHYERFTGVNATRLDAVSTGQIYSTVIANERRGTYLGATVQVVPHITDAIQEALTKDVSEETDFLIAEIGGTVGDIEGLPFLEAIRQYANRHGSQNVLFLHLVLMPFLGSSHEVKTKPAQHSVKELLSVGIQADILLCRSDIAFEEDVRTKLASFCNIPSENVIEALNVASVYEVPLNYAQAGLDRQVLKHFGLKDQTPDLSIWQDIVQRLKNPKERIRIAVVGKYAGLKDAYKSLDEALVHGGIPHQVHLEVDWIDAEQIEETQDIADRLAPYHGFIIPGGFGNRGIEGKKKTITYARTHRIPFLGICMGMQLAVIEFAQNVLGIASANSSEFGPVDDPLVGLMTQWQRDGVMETRDASSDMGGTMRLGAYECHIREKTLALSIYGKERIWERHRHRYEVNPHYQGEFESKGLIFSAFSPDGRLPEMIELQDHPWFVATQAHPELISRPFRPHPLFQSFVKACLDHQKGELS